MEATQAFAYQLILSVVHNQSASLNTNTELFVGVHWFWESGSMIETILFRLYCIHINFFSAHIFAALVCNLVLNSGSTIFLFSAPNILACKTTVDKPSAFSTQIYCLSLHTYRTITQGWWHSNAYTFASWHLISIMVFHFKFSHIRQY